MFLFTYQIKTAELIDRGEPTYYHTCYSLCITDYVGTYEDETFRVDECCRTDLCNDPPSVSSNTQISITMMILVPVVAFLK